MQYTIKSEFEIGDDVLINNEVVGKIVGASVKMNSLEINTSVIIIDKYFIVNVDGEISEVPEKYLQKDTKWNYIYYL